MSICQLEYKIAILGDKWEYLGEDCCSEEEKKLAVLREFPPLSYLFYPAASLAYVREKEEPWKCSLAAKLSGRGCKTGERYLVCKNGIPV